MSRSRSRFTQSEIARAIRAVQQCDADMTVEIGRDGVIKIVKAERKDKRTALDPVKEISF